MPILVYGVYQIPPEETEKWVLDAISIGYRAIDTAQAIIMKRALVLLLKKWTLQK
jgi:diketogulonate reductase-like aldo/keto reductase